MSKNERSGLWPNRMDIALQRRLRMPIVTYGVWDSLVLRPM
jgi:hypothetical protein